MVTSLKCANPENYLSNKLQRDITAVGHISNLNNVHMPQQARYVEGEISENAMTESNEWDIFIVHSRWRQLSLVSMLNYKLTMWE